MKKFLEKFTNKLTGDEESTSSRSSTSTPVNRKVVAVKPTQRSIDNTPDMINAASQTLSKAIDDILNDSSSISGESIEGYLRLIHIMEVNHVSKDPAEIINRHGEGCLSILLDLIESEGFVDICNQHGLPVGLFNSLRMLRMYEIKIYKLQQQGSLHESRSTLLAATRIFNLLAVMCASIQTVELMRPSLVKFFTFPLNPLPAHASHLQELGSQLISITCKSSLTSSIIWYLHDIQIMRYVTKNLTDILGSSHQQPSNDGLLRGAAAESAGMLLVCLKCIINILNSSLQFGTVLLTDFDKENGFPLIANFIEMSNGNNMIAGLSEVSRLMHDPLRDIDDPSIYIPVAKVFNDVLLSTLGLKRKINVEDTYPKLMSICQYLFDRSTRFNGRESLIQSLAYTLLTIYSNDPKYCIALEEEYHFLPTLLVAIPAISSADCISAVLTALNYVCQCVVNVAQLPILAFSAVATVIVNNVLNNKYDKVDKDHSQFQVDICFSSFEAIIRTNSQHALGLVRCGLLKYFICFNFEQLCTGLSTTDRVPEEHVNLYIKIANLVVSINNRNVAVADEIRNSGLMLLFRTCIINGAVPPELAKALIYVPEALSRSDTSHLKESMIMFMEMINILENNHVRMKYIVDSLRVIVLTTIEGAHVWVSIRGRSVLCELLGRYKGLFGSNDQSIVQQQAVECLGSILQLVAADIMMNLTLKSDVVYDDAVKEIRQYLTNVTANLINTGIFRDASHCPIIIKSLVNLIIAHDGPHSLGLRNVESIEILLVVIPVLSNEMRCFMLEKLFDVIKNYHGSCKDLSERGIIQLIIANFYSEFKSGEKWSSILWNIVEYVMNRFLKSEDVIALMYYLVRPSLISQLSDVENSLLPPWISNSKYSNANDDFWLFMRPFLTNIESESVPFVRLGHKFSYSGNVNPIYLNAVLSELSEPLPSSGLTFTCWFRVQRDDDSSTTGPIGRCVFLALTSNPNSECFLQLEYSSQRKCFFVIMKRGSDHIAISFKPHVAIDPYDWNFVSLTFKRPRRYGLAKSSANLYVNGLLAVPINSDSLDTDFPQNNQNIELIIGKAFVSDGQWSTINEDSSMASNLPEKLAQCWDIGPVLLFEEIISQSQISTIFLKGPTYSGTMQGKCPLVDSNYPIITSFIKHCVHVDNVERYSDALGLKGIESTVDPATEASFGMNVFPDFPTLPIPILAYSSHNRVVSTIYVKASNVLVSKELLDLRVRYEQVGLLNSVNLESKTLLLNLSNGSFYNSSHSFGSCISNIGGPIMLFPLLQSASSEEHICKALRCLRMACSENIQNIRYMQKIGYKLMAFLLILKPKELITISVLQELIRFAAVETPDPSNSGAVNYLLVDTVAFYYLVLNHQIWDMSRFLFCYKVVDYMWLLTKDSRFGYHNGRKLSSLGAIRWIILACVYGVESNLATDSSQIGSLGNVWKFSKATDEDVADNNEEKDLFLNLSTSLLLRLLSIDIRKRDLELISYVISYSFSPSRNVVKDFLDEASSTQLVGAVMKIDRPASQWNSNNSEQNSESTTRGKILSPISLFRVYILRMLSSLYEEHNLDQRIYSRKGSFPEVSQKISTQLTQKRSQFFRNAFNPEWFVNLIEKITEVSTRSYCLRLLGMFIQEDEGFERDFFSKEGYRTMLLLLTADCQPLPVILPIIALLFRIPMHILPYSFQVKVASKVTQLLELDECKGPNCSDTGSYEFTLPLLTLLMECLSNIVRSKLVTAESTLVLEVILGTLEKAVEQYPCFRQFFQNRHGIDLLSATMLACSNAVDDYGSHIFSTSSDSMDLSEVLKEDYIVDDGFSGDFSRSIDLIDDLNSSAGAFIDRTLANGGVSANVDTSENIELTQEGKRILGIIAKIIDSGILEHDNTAVLCHFLLAYPSNMVDHYARSFQMIIFERTNQIIEFLIQKHFGSKVMLTVSNIFTQLVPLARARVLDTNVQLKLFRQILHVIEKLRAHGEMSDQLAEMYQPIIRDLILTARFLASTLIQIISMDRFSTADDAFRVEVMTLIRYNIRELLTSFHDDITDISGAKLMSKANNGDSTSSAMLEAFQMSWNPETFLPGSKKQPNESLSICQSERLKLSQSFVPSLANICYNFASDSNANIAKESMRILALLLIHRRPLMEQLFFPTVNGNKVMGANKRNASLDALDGNSEVFADGMLKLLPPASFLMAYSSFLAGHASDSFGEPNRFNEFQMWLKDNYSRIDTCLSSIDSYLKSLMPSATETSCIIRQIQASRAKDEMHRNGSRVMNTMKRVLLCQRHEDQLISQLKRWALVGIYSLGNIAMHWKREWEQLQSGPIWGYLPYHDLSKDRGLTLANMAQTMHGSDSKIPSTVTIPNYRGWKLDNSEGNERMRRKLEQFYFYPRHVRAHVSSRPPAPSKSTNNSMNNNNNNSDSPSKSNSSSKGNVNMEEFMKRIAVQGGNKKDGKQDMEGFDDLSDLSTSLESSLTSQDVADISAKLSMNNNRMNSTTDSETLEGFNNMEDDEFAVARDNIDTSEMPVETGVLWSSNKRDGSRNIKNNANRVTKSSILVEMLRGMLGNQEITQGYVLNILRISGLEATPALMVLTNSHIHIINGFSVHKSTSNIAADSNQASESPHAGSGSSSRTSKPVALSTLKDRVIRWLSDESPDVEEIEGSTSAWLSRIWMELLSVENSYYRLPFTEVYSIFKRRHQLKDKAMEVTDLTGYSVLYACDTVEENNDVLLHLLESELPNSIFHKVIEMRVLHLLRGVHNLYKKLMSTFLYNLTKMWQNGELSNFEYLIHLNSAAGRSFQDLTQYPVFPWILADYSSDSIDLNNPKVYRDLSKPMGAIGPRRAAQFRERFKETGGISMNDSEQSFPYHFGTHYSSTGYVLNYLVRLRPYSDLHIELQSGQFDKPDRLFYNINNSWISASQENLQDVRELTPEFFFLPEFLVNDNRFDFGTTQRGDVVDHVEVPAWAHGCPREFVRINRQALESKYVSENLNDWIDLIFGYKQRGEAAENALNVFRHYTYVGNVDVDSIENEVDRLAAIAEINEFGQCPAMLFEKPHPKRIVPEITRKIGENLVVDSIALSWHSHVSPPLCVVGAPKQTILNRMSLIQTSYMGNFDKGLPVGDIRLLSRDRIVVVPKGYALVPPNYKKFLKYQGAVGTLGFLTNFNNSQRLNENDKDNIWIEDVHVKKIVTIALSKDGKHLVTGSEDTTVRLWSLNHINERSIEHIHTYVGHTAGITCVDIDSDSNMVISGGLDRSVCCWDTRTGCLRFILPNHDDAVVAVSINPVNGNIVTLTSNKLCIYSVNGHVIVNTVFADSCNAFLTIPRACSLLATPCPEWLHGVVAVTGHEGGYFYLWKVVEEMSESSSNPSQILRLADSPSRAHRADITCIKLGVSSSGGIAALNSAMLGVPTTAGNSGVDRTFDEAGTLDLLVGDSDGVLSRWSVQRLDQMSITEVQSMIQ